MNEKTIYLTDTLFLDCFRNGTRRRFKLINFVPCGWNFASDIQIAACGARYCFPVKSHPSDDVGPVRTVVRLCVRLLGGREFSKNLSEKQYHTATV